MSFAVLPSPLFAAVSGGRGLVGLGSLLTLNASSSSDPDGKIAIGIACARQPLWLPMSCAQSLRCLLTGEFVHLHPGWPDSVSSLTLDRHSFCRGGWRPRL